MQTDQDEYFQNLRRIGGPDKRCSIAASPKFRTQKEVIQAVRRYHRLQMEVLAEYGLTEREKDVAIHLLHGVAYAHIARILILTESTIRFHVGNILRKCNVRNRYDLSFMILIKLYTISKTE